MKKGYKIGFSVILFVLGLSFLFKFYQINNIITDGDGVGITFFGMEINDKIIISDIHTYRNAFLAIGVIILVISLIFAFSYFKQIRGEKIISTQK